jgi:hypothetical protein
MAFTIAPTMFTVGVCVIPKTVKLVPENQKNAWTKAWNASAPQANFAISGRKYIVDSYKEYIFPRH